MAGHAGCIANKVTTIACAIAPAWVKNNTECDGLRRMHSIFCNFIDRWAIRFAAARVSRRTGADPHLEMAQSLLQSPDFFAEGTPVAEMTFTGGKSFQFPSPVRTPFAENNLVHGSISRCGRNWRLRPAVILLHGWNDRLGYRHRLPWLAKCYNRRGVNSVMFELPYHFQRRPSQAGAIRNFISEDAGGTIQAAHQALAEINCMVGWLLQQGCPRVALMGFSLGGWLGGLAVCHDPRISSAALITPVSLMDRMIKESPLCEPVRRALKDHPMDLTRLNLPSHKPKLSRGYILLIGAEHDLFVPPETTGELWEAWGTPEYWILPQGHISILACSKKLKRAAKWIGLRLKMPDSGSGDMIRSADPSTSIHLPTAPLDT
jgi:pimeloyl-ACP methyl ester carboxylesterase